MRKRSFIICLSVLLILSVALNCVFILKLNGTPRLNIQIGKPLNFDQDGNIASSYVKLIDDRDAVQVVLLSMIIAQPVPEDVYPTEHPDGVVTVLYKGCGYPYKMWFYEDYIILGTENGTCRKIQNDHNNGVPLLKELVASIEVK